MPFVYKPSTIPFDAMLTPLSAPDEFPSCDCAEKPLGMLNPVVPSRPVPPPETVEPKLKSTVWPPVAPMKSRLTG